jgi:hypothetical protein
MKFQNQNQFPLINCHITSSKKIDEKQKIDEKIQQANNVLQSKNVSIEAINEHMKLNEKLSVYGPSTHNIDELLNLVLNAKRYG